MSATSRSLQLGLDALFKTSRRPDNAALIQRLIPIAQELARARPDGITIADLRVKALQLQVVLPKKPHFLGGVMKAAGLVSTGAMRRSTIDASHGNLQRVWIQPLEREL